MKHATRLVRLGRHAATLFFRFAHGGLLTVGVLAVVFVVSQYFESGDFPSLASAAPAEVPIAHSDPFAAVPAADQADSANALSPGMKRVADFLGQRYRVSPVALEPVLSTAESTGRSLGVDPLVLVAVMAIESRFNPFAQGSGGAQGLMQVIPRFHLDKIGAGAQSRHALFDPRTNIRVGAQVLKEGIVRFGSLHSALQYYCGGLNDPRGAGYAVKVLAVKEQLAAAARREGV